MQRKGMLKFNIEFTTSVEEAHGCNRQGPYR